MALVILKKLSFVDLSGNDVSADITQYIIKKEFTCDMCSRVCMLNRGLCLVCSELKRHPDHFYSGFGRHIRSTRSLNTYHFPLDDKYNGILKIPEHIFCFSGKNIDDLEKYLRIKVLAVARHQLGIGHLVLKVEAIESLWLLLDYDEMIRDWLRAPPRYQNTIIFRDPMVEFVPI